MSDRAKVNAFVRTLLLEIRHEPNPNGGLGWVWIWIFAAAAMAWHLLRK